jgi:hypothetical protein
MNSCTALRAVSLEDTVGLKARAWHDPFVIRDIIYLHAVADTFSYADLEHLARPLCRHGPGRVPDGVRDGRRLPGFRSKSLFLLARVPLVSEHREVKLGAPFAFEELVEDQAGLLPHAQPPGQPHR